MDPYLSQPTLKNAHFVLRTRLPWNIWKDFEADLALFLETNFKITAFHLQLITASSSDLTVSLIFDVPYDVANIVEKSVSTGEFCRHLDRVHGLQSGSDCKVISCVITEADPRPNIQDKTTIRGLETRITEFEIQDRKRVYQIRSIMQELQQMQLTFQTEINNLSKKVDTKLDAFETKFLPKETAFTEKLKKAGVSIRSELAQ